MLTLPRRESRALEIEQSSGPFTGLAGRPHGPGSMHSNPMLNFGDYAIIRLGGVNIVLARESLFFLLGVELLLLLLASFRIDLTVMDFAASLAAFAALAFAFVNVSRNNYSVDLFLPLVYLMAKISPPPRLHK